MPSAVISYPVGTSIANSIFVRDDGNDGTGTRERLDLPFLTISAALSTASSGDVVYVGPGSFTENSGLQLPSGVSLIGSGQDVTTINSNLALTNKVVLSPGINSVVSDLTVNATVGAAFGAFTNNVTSTGVKVYRCKFLGISDSVYYSTALAHSASFYECVITAVSSTSADSLLFNPGNVTDLLECFDCIINSTGGSTGEVNGVKNSGAVIRMFGGRIIVTGSTGDVYCISSAGTTTEAYNVRLERGTGSASSRDLRRTGGTLAINNVATDDGAALTTTGTITYLTAQGGVFNAVTGFRILDAAATGKILIGDGTNFIVSTPTYPNTAPASGAVLIGDGTNYVGDTTPTLVDILTLAAGSTTIAPLNIQAASALKTTPADGDIEMDANCLYGCTDVGNRGYVPIVHIIRADSTVTQANDANPHAIFTTPTNGRLTLEAGSYRVQGLLAWTSMSNTSGNLQIDLLGAGTATVAAWLWLGTGQDQASGQQGAQIGASWMVTNISNTNIATAAGNTAFVLKIDGTFEVTVAGTIIPTQTVKTAAAAVLSVGSFLEFWRIGNNTMTNVGQWD